MNRILEYWLQLTIIAIFLIFLRRDRNEILSDLNNLILKQHPIHGMLTFISVVILAPLTIISSIKTIWNN
jgi:hypothetical protein